MRDTLTGKKSLFLWTMSNDHGWGRSKETVLDYSDSFPMENLNIALPPEILLISIGLIYFREQCTTTLACKATISAGEHRRGRPTQRTWPSDQWPGPKSFWPPFKLLFLFHPAALPRASAVWVWRVLSGRDFKALSPSSPPGLRSHRCSLSWPHGLRAKYLQNIFPPDFNI